MRDQHYDILFEPVQIGPHRTRNRFYQVPHCTGMGYRYPNAEARHRGVKAEGGWGVISTQETEIHPTSDLSPANEARLWSDEDIPALQLMTEQVHEGGALAAIQLAHNGHHSPNMYSRMAPLAPSDTPVDWGNQVQARAMDLADIKTFRKWHVDAAKRAKRAGFDIVYVYAGHDMTLLQHFLLQRHNKRTDEYGGTFENRLRLFREVIDDTKDAVGDSCAIAVRLAVDELMGPMGLRHDHEGRDILAALGEVPDLWDVNLSNWSNDSQTARFANEGYQEDYTKFVKAMTSKPVVGVGRYTSPDTMVRLVKEGHLDLIGAARPSIADPFLPTKIETGRIDDIRECIGCNICVTGDNSNVPMRCTQNPSVGEEFRRGWHPDIIPSAKSAESFLIIGGGPAGLEAGMTLSKGGHDVSIAEKDNRWGGRVSREAALPGLASWGRVRDWRMMHLKQAANAQLYLESTMTADDVLTSEAKHIVLATGAEWRRDGFGKHHRMRLDFLDHHAVLTPDDVMTHGLDSAADGPVVIFDDDGYYMGSVMAELAAASGRQVSFVMPNAVVAPWTDLTLEQSRIQTRLIELGVHIIPLHGLEDFDGTALTIGCTYSGRTQKLDASAVITVTSRKPDTTLWDAVMARKDEFADLGIASVDRIGDGHNPGLIAHAVYAGHEYAQAYLSDAPDLFHRTDIAKISQ